MPQYSFQISSFDFGVTLSADEISTGTTPAAATMLADFLATVSICATASALMVSADAKALVNSSILAIAESRSETMAEVASNFSFIASNSADKVSFFAFASDKSFAIASASADLPVKAVFNAWRDCSRVIF